jgi:hypothetical protein
LWICFHFTLDLVFLGWYFHHRHCQRS